MTAADVIASLRLLHPDPEWAFIDELRIGTGYSGDSEQRLDAWVISCWPSKGLDCITYEVKVSRSDFRHELKHPEKRLPGLRYSNRFYFATPKGLVKRAEVPPECGLVEIDPVSGKAVIVREAPFREIDPPPKVFVAAIARRSARSGRSAKEVLELDAELAERRRSDGAERARRRWEGSQKLELEVASEALLLASGWTISYGQCTHPTLAAKKVRLREALRLEAEARGSAPLPRLTWELLELEQLEQRYAGKLKAGASLESELDGVEHSAHREGRIALHELAAEHVDRFCGHRIFKSRGVLQSFEVCELFLNLNGYRLDASEEALALLGAEMSESLSVPGRRERIAAALEPLIVLGDPHPAAISERLPKLAALLPKRVF